MRIAQLSIAERDGGAERIALDLHHGYRAAGHDARLLTPRPLRDHAGKTTTPGVIGIDEHAGRLPWVRWLSRYDRRAARPVAAVRRRLGYDDYAHPWTSGLLDLLPWTPDVLHLHNLHGGWFDLRQLAPLSHKLPVVATLHDAVWATGGPHFPCIAPSWREHVVEKNRKRRAPIFRDSRLRVATPSRWMLGLINGGSLEPGVIERRVIHNGVDTDVYSPGPREPGRRRLGVSDDEHLLLMVAMPGRRGFTHKDPQTALQAVRKIDPALRPATLCFVGSNEPPTQSNGVTVLHHPVVTDRSELTELYRAADALVHAAHEDNFPTVILEAMACGLPCVATDRGGMPEQIIEKQTGFVVPTHDPEALAVALNNVLGDESMRVGMGCAARKRACEHFTLERMTRDYLEWFAGFVPDATGLRC